MIINENQYGKYMMLNASLIVAYGVTLGGLAYLIKGDAVLRFLYLLLELLIQCGVACLQAALLARVSMRWIVSVKSRYVWNAVWIFIFTFVRGMVSLLNIKAFKNIFPLHEFMKDLIVGTFSVSLLQFTILFSTIISIVIMVILVKESEKKAVC